MTDFVDGLEFTFTAILEIFMIFANSSIPSNERNRTCHASTENNIINASVSGMSIIFFFTFAFLTRRVSFKKNSCYGRPGLAMPMNIINRHDHTVEYVLAFLTVSEDIYGIVFEVDIMSMLPVDKFIAKISFGILVSLMTYQIFTAIHVETLIGYIIGTISTAGFLILHFLTNYGVVSCLNGSEKYPKILVSTIRLGIEFTLFCTFVWKLITHIRYKCLQVHEPVDSVDVELNECYQYVRSLLKSNGTAFNNLDKRNERFWNKLKNHRITRNFKNTIYYRVIGFRNPPRLIIGLAVGFYFAYRIFMDEIENLTPGGWNALRLIQSKYGETHMNLRKAFTIASGNYSQYPREDIGNAYRFLALFYTNLLINCFISAVFIGFLNTIIQILLVLRHYRLSFMKINKKGFSSIIPLKKVSPPCGLILGFVKYSGFQAAYIFWGVSVVTFFVFVFLFILIGIFLLPLIYLEKSWARKTFLLYYPLVITTLIFNSLQYLIVKFLFTKEKGALMEINNQRAFTIYAHCAFFFNVMIGIFNSLFRIIIWILSGIFCFCRIDFSSLPIYLQTFDTGYMAYLGFLYTEQFHHNPILKCFAGLLVEYQKKLSVDESILINDIDEDTGVIRSKYYKKWHVAFTLINNPQLQVSRKNKNIMITTDVIA